jgi:hypothetical protein
MDRPLLVVMMTGWIDASNAAAAAMEMLVERTSATTVHEFDPDQFIDYRARRPTMELRDGVNTRIEWSTPKVMLGRDRNHRDILLLTGPEPDAKWQFFAAEVANLARSLGVRRMLGLGAYPVATPHTRDVKMSCTCNSVELANSLPYLKNSLDVPAGVEAVLERAMSLVEIDAIGLWAQVPHYVSSMSYPAASLALINAVSEVGSVELDSGDLREMATMLRDRLNHLMKENPEHETMLRQLEYAFDVAHSPEETPLVDGPLPSGDQLAAELEQFLREHRSDS